MLIDCKMVDFIVLSMKFDKSRLSNPKLGFAQKMKLSKIIIWVNKEKYISSNSFLLNLAFVFFCSHLKIC